ncbi:MAG TPA: outer membrane beta-barrel family protein [Chitinophagaceae bacterium]
MRKLSLLFPVLLLTVLLNAQTQRGKVTVSVGNDQQQSIENATVEILRKKDSVLVKAGITDKAGVAELENIRLGEYLLKVSMVNYGPSFSSFTLTAENNNITIPKVTLQPKAAQLGGVTVTSRKPFIQKLSDRIVVNVENSIVSAGSSAMDVLERSPGVNVDQNDAISLRGRAGVIIMIDGKPTAMTGQDLANYLRGLPSAAIERIDIITNPSAKYDAAGNSGIIDIRMKKDQRMGTNGTFTAGYGQGVYPKANAGTTFNYRNKKLNVFGNYNYAYRIGLNHLLLDRNFYTNGVYNGGDLKDNYARMPFSVNTARLGMDYFPSKKTIVGFVVNSNFVHFKRDNNNKSIVLDQDRDPINTFEALATNNDRNRNIVTNINFKHTFDSTGKELTADVDYGHYKSHSLSRNATRYYKLDGISLQPDYILDGDQNGKLTFKTAKIDYVNPMKKGAKWEAGFKTSFVSSDNDAKFYDVSDGTPEDDVNKTNHFLYDENNNAGYINFSKQFKKWDIQVGLRGEYTDVKNPPGQREYRLGLQLFPVIPQRIL